MNEYQQEQWEAYFMVQRHFAALSLAEKEKLKEMAADYFEFRRETDRFLSEHFGSICTMTCYQNKLSACCSREGIITFFADVVINALVSSHEEIELLMTALKIPNTGFKCIYLGKNGCMWKIKPIVCEMFLCDRAEKEVFDKNPQIRNMWEEFRKREKRYTWPDRPVLFDALEQYFIDTGLTSSLMYMHNSPGLLRVKQKSMMNGK